MIFFLCSLYVHQSGFSRKSELIHIYIYMYICICLYNTHMHACTYTYKHKHTYTNIYFKELDYITVEIGMFKIHRAG